MTVILYIDRDTSRATLRYPSGVTVDLLRLRLGGYVRIDDSATPNPTYPQVCEGGRAMGNTLVYRSPETLARDLGAKLYRTRRAFDAAIAKAEGRS